MGRDNDSQSYAGYIYASDPRYRDSIPESVKSSEIKLGQPSAEYVFFDNAFELLDLCNAGKTKMRNTFRSLASSTEDGTIDFGLILDFFPAKETSYSYTRAVSRIFELLTAQLPKGHVESYNIAEFVQLAKNVVKDRKNAYQRPVEDTNVSQRRNAKHARAMTLWNKESGKLKAACRAEAEKMSQEDENQPNNKEKKKSMIPHISVVTGFILFLAIMFFGFVYVNRRERKAGNSTDTGTNDTEFF